MHLLALDIQMITEGCMQHIWL